MDGVVKPEEFERYFDHGHDFIDDGRIERLLRTHAAPDRQQVRDVVAKSLALKRLEPEETAVLLNVRDAGLWDEIFAAAGQIKNNVYGPRVVTFAPLYCSNLCVNSCLYCGFRHENAAEKRRRLTIEDVRRETEVLVSLGHKRLIVVYGEHPSSDVDYMEATIRAIYETKVGRGEIRRVNINAAPLSIANFKRLHEVGIGTYQIFQETYHHETYRQVHPAGPKANYDWRLYALHRAQQGGIDDVAIGALFGLYDWRFEVMGLLYHTIDLEEKFGGVGPHTISFPRLMPASNAPLATGSRYRVTDEDFLRLIAVLRLSVPYTGMIVTARESAAIRRAALDLGCTQTDASTRIGVGSYSDACKDQDAARQQFMLGDTRSLDEVVRELAQAGYLTSFCTAGYRCGRTGAYFMKIAKTGKVHLFCIPNAILTFKEYLLDYASPETREIGERLIQKRLADVPESVRPAVVERLREIEDGKRDERF